MIWLTSSAPGLSLKIYCKDDKQRNKILNSSSINGIDINASLLRSEERRERETKLRLHRVAISGVPVDITVDKIREETGTAFARRIKKRNEQGNQVTTMTVMLAYDRPETEVPAKVHMRWLVFKVSTYIPSVTRCYRCQGYSHAARHCYRTDDICPACAGKHKFEVCPNKEEKKCANCKDDYSAGSRDCPK